ncbi:MAG: DUF2332 family protein [Solirubrobacterales bacterium]|nr:DUF2332 family protein [Solirubrobacterales bacterium]
MITTVLARSTRTNEPARCATLLPLLATLPQPLALLEVGAAAGLCLLPDRWAYDYDGLHVPPPRPAATAPPTVRVPREPVGAAARTQSRDCVASGA